MGLCGGNTKINATFSSKNANICLNRTLLCCFAVLLLWITTLRLCVDIANTYVKPPPLPQVIKVCEDMAETAEVQRAHYSACVSNQMDVCQEHLDTGKLSLFTFSSLSFLLSLLSLFLLLQHNLTISFVSVRSYSYHLITSHHLSILTSPYHHHLVYSL